MFSRTFDHLNRKKLKTVKCHSSLSFNRFIQRTFLLNIKGVLLVPRLGDMDLAANCLTDFVQLTQKLNGFGYFNAKKREDPGGKNRKYVF